MKPEGWAFMISSWSLIILLVVYCVAKIMTIKRTDEQEEHVG